MPNYPLVRVRWLDSTSPKDGWITLSSWKGVGSLDCVSVGYLIRDTEQSKTIAPHLAYPDDADNCQGNGIIVIPAGAIVSMDQLTSMAISASADEVSDHIPDRPVPAQLVAEPS